VLLLLQFLFGLLLRDLLPQRSCVFCSLVWTITTGEEIETTSRLIAWARQAVQCVRVGGGGGGDGAGTLSVLNRVIICVMPRFGPHLYSTPRPHNPVRPPGLSGRFLRPPKASGWHEFSTSKLSSVSCSVVICA
jgi:hypothetical protein